MKLIILSVFGAIAFCGSLCAQQPFVNGTMSSDGSSLCMAVNGNAGSGSPIVTADCVSGSPSQLFSVAADGSVHFGATNSSYCVAGVPHQNGVRLFAPGNALALYPCQQVTAGAFRVDTRTYQTSSRLCVTDGDTSGYCYSTAYSTPGQAVVLNFETSQIAAAQVWTATIVARWLSKNLNPFSLLTSQGCLLDAAGQTIAAPGCGLVAIAAPSGNAPLGAAYSASSVQVSLGTVTLTTAGNGGKIVAQGGGNIVAQGGGNIVAQGGGNIVAQGGGNITYVDRSGKPVADSLVNGSGTNIVAQGGGNIVAQGGGNIVSQGGGNYTTLSTNGAFSYGQGTTAALQSTLNAITQTLLTVNNSAYKATTSVPAAPAQPYTVTNVSADPGPWAPGSTHTIAWQGTGSPAAGEVIYVYFQASTGAMATLCANVAPGTGRCSGVTPNAPGTYGSVDVWDSVSRKNAYVATQVQISALQPFTLSPAIRIDGNVPATNQTLAWAAASPHQLQWSWTGGAAANETVSFWLGSLRLASGIPAAQGYYNLPANSARSGSTGVLILKDDLTNKQVNGPAVQVH